MEQFVEEMFRYLTEEQPDKNAISKRKADLAKKHGLGHVPTDIEIFLRLRPEQAARVKQLLLTKPTRSMSGVSVVAVMAKPYPCPHGRCLPCPGGPASDLGDLPQSYTGLEPATRRALRNRFDPYLQVFNRLEQYVASGHVPEKVELIIMGGTFMAMPWPYVKRFVTRCYQALNDFSRAFYKTGRLDLLAFRRFFMLPGDITDIRREKEVQRRVIALRKAGARLLDEQRRNETAHIRAVGLTVETRSDCASPSDAGRMLELGCTRAELGVQSVYGHALKWMQRGHGTEQTVRAIRVLKDHGFKINAHYMPGLNVSPARDLDGMLKLFADPRYRPDMLKIYPCLVIKGTRLHHLWKNGRYRPLTTSKAVRLIAGFKAHVPEYCRIMRIQRDIPLEMVAAGVGMTNLRQLVAAAMRRQGRVCRCIRCREIGRAQRPEGAVRLRRMSYEASSGTEHFISAEQSDHIIGFCRLRFPSQPLRTEITRKTAIIRELHVYGEALAIGARGRYQHSGIGKRLVAAAEAISQKAGMKRIAIISGIGVRQYYRRLGYRRQGPYMVRVLNTS